MVRLDGGWPLLGSDLPEAFPHDGESPVRKVWVDPFFIAKHPVTNEEFGEFVKRSGYVTEAEREGWSLVFRNHIAEDKRMIAVPGTPWWFRVEGAVWSRPVGPRSDVDALPHHPAVQVSWNDARAYCEWAGVRLPTEAEWEFAARGGLEQKRYPWGDELTPEGRHMCNVWQGSFPELDLAEDGFSTTAPVESFAPNDFGLYTVIGNTWEWCSDFFDPLWRRTETRVNPQGPLRGSGRVLKGGSYLCHESYCYRYRNSARTYNSEDTGTTNIGFRVVRDVKPLK
ncbi:MAG: formylglycine-generating enzyme family protein [Bryobacteraceae bacterium]